jgi:FAD/FMN-containing dehydrogenase
MFSPEQVRQMRNIKMALDPDGIFNPSDMFTEMGAE